MHPTRLIAVATPLALGLFACGGDEPSLVEQVRTYELRHNEHDIEAPMEFRYPVASSS